jgi:hypothetical protein
MSLDVMQFHHINYLEMNSGDEIELSVNLGILSEVKKCGIHVLVDEPNVIDEDEILLQKMRSIKVSTDNCNDPSANREHNPPQI